MLNGEKQLDFFITMRSLKDGQHQLIDLFAWVVQIPGLNLATIPLGNGEQGEALDSMATWNTPLRSTTGSGLLTFTFLQKEVMEQGKDMMNQQEDDLYTLHAENAVKSVEF